MRVDDLPLPPNVPDLYPEGSPLAGWAGQPHIIIERLPTFAYGWDDEDPAVVWDAAGDPYVWDANPTGADFVDASCDFQAVGIEVGDPDELNLYPAGQATVTLDNRSGDWSQYDESGRLVYFAPGRRLLIYALWNNYPWHLFAGVIESWDLNADGSVTVECTDRFSGLAQELGVEWTPGSAGQKPRERLAAIAQMAGDTGPWRADPGDVALTTQLSDRSPLEEMEVVTLSDGGLLFVDADGALIYRDRLWPRGRNDQSWIPVFSDNVCGAEFIVWDTELSTADEHLVTRVVLVNVAGVGVTAVTTNPLLSGQQFMLTHPDPDQWTTQAEGQAVADGLLALYEEPRVGIRRFELHLLDPNQDLWRAGIDRRLGDRIRFLHDFPAAGGEVGSFNLTMIVTTITHQITPESWVVGIGTGPAVDATVVQRWDRTDWLWDDPDARWDF